jgi:hypothetical protein
MNIRDGVVIVEIRTTFGTRGDAEARAEHVLVAVRRGTCGGVSLHVQDDTRTVAGVH